MWTLVGNVLQLMVCIIKEIVICQLLTVAQVGIQFGKNQHRGCDYHCGNFGEYFHRDGATS